MLVPSDRQTTVLELGCPLEYLMPVSTGKKVNTLVPATLRDLFIPLLPNVCCSAKSKTRVAIRAFP